MGIEVNAGLALDVLIGLAFLYFLFSLVCSAVNEAVASIFKWRAKDLKLAIVNLIGAEKTDALYADARVQALGKVKRSRRSHKSITESAQTPGFMRCRRVGRLGYVVDGTSPLRRRPPAAGTREFHLRDPSYIPSQTFAQVALDLLVNEEREGEDAYLSRLSLRRRDKEETRLLCNRALENSDPLAVSSLRATDLRGLASGAREKLKDAQDELEDEFDRVMERVGGWYKRKATIGVAVIATLVVCALNVDTVNVTKRLLAEPAAASAIASRAAQEVEAGSGQAEELGSVNEQVAKAREAGFPLGWSDLPWKGDHNFGDVASKLFGLLLTIAAITLGAPFWFQLLGRLAPLRATGAKPASSED